MMDTQPSASIMFILVTLPALLTVASSALLQSYSLPHRPRQPPSDGPPPLHGPGNTYSLGQSLGHTRKDVLTQSYEAPTQPNGPGQLQGHVGSNDQSQTLGRLTRNQGPERTQTPAGDDLTQTFGGTTGPQGHLQYHGLREPNYRIQSFGGPAGPHDPIKLPGSTRQDVFIQTFTALTRKQGPEQPQDSAGKQVPIRTYGEPERQHNAAHSQDPAGVSNQSQTFRRPTGLHDLSQHQFPVGDDVFGEREEQQVSMQPHGPPHTFVAHTEQNDRTQIHSISAGPHSPTQSQDFVEQNAFGGSAAEPQRPENPQNLAGQDVLPQSFEEPTRHDGSSQHLLPAGQDGQTHKTTGPNNLTQTYEGLKVLYDPPQHHGTDGQDVFRGITAEPHDPAKPHGPVGPQLGNGCLQGKVLHTDGSCVVPEITRDVYIFSIPEMPRRPKRPLPRLPTPKVHEHVLFIRTPEGRDGPEPLLVPPPAHKSVVYILRKESGDEEPRLIQAPAPPPAHPEVFFVNYEDSDNPSFPSGLSLQHVLQTAVPASPSLLDDTSSGDVTEAPETTYSGPRGQTGDNLVLEGHSNDNLALMGHSDASITLGGHSYGSPALESHSDGGSALGGNSGDDFALESGGDSGLVLESHTESGSISGSHTDDFSQKGHSNSDFTLSGHNENEQEESLGNDSANLASFVNTNDINDDYRGSHENTGNVTATQEFQGDARPAFLQKGELAFPLKLEKGDGGANKERLSGDDDRQAGLRVLPEGDTDTVVPPQNLYSSPDASPAPYTYHSTT